MSGVTDKKFPLTALASELRRLTGKCPTYRVLYARVLNGELPAEQVNGRWHVRREDLPEIASHFGLTIQSENAQ